VEENLANMAHDLRTPLASVQSYVEALEDGIIQDEETFQRYLATIRSETVRLGELIQDLFELSTLDSVKSEQKEYTPAIAEDVLVDLLPRFTRQLESKEIQVKVVFPGRQLRVKMPSNDLQRIFQNLLENAVRYSPRGGIITIEAEEKHEGTMKEIRFTVCDSGEGIPSGEEQRIFERFYRADRSRTRESGGAGLGLAIAKLLVGQHGGQIGVQPAAQHGSVFWFAVQETD
jgi:two-component system sensor histidine kinase SaeS